jgi:hypothetical protein
VNQLLKRRIQNTEILNKLYRQSLVEATREFKKLNHLKRVTKNLCKSYPDINTKIIASAAYSKAKETLIIRKLVSLSTTDLLSLYVQLESLQNIS